jgi:hypothetical protein
MLYYKLTDILKSLINKLIHIENVVMSITLVYLALETIMQNAPKDSDDGELQLCVLIFWTLSRDLVF